MKMRLLCLVLVLCGIAYGNVFAQTFTPNTYAMGNATLGAPKYFNFVYTHHHTSSAKFQGNICQGYAGMHTLWMRRSDSSDIHDVLIPAGDTVEGVLRLIPYEIGPLTTSCGLVLFDSLMQTVGNSGYAISGFVTSSPKNSVSVSELQFGEVAPGTSLSKNVVLRNTGNGDAYMRMLTSASSPFSTSLDSVWVVKANDSIVVPVTFSPTEAIAYVDTVAIGNAFFYTDKPLIIRLEGTGGSTEAEIVAPVMSIRMQDVSAGETTNIEVAFIAPRSNVIIDSIGLKLNDPAFVAVKMSLPRVILAMDTFNVRVTFRPTTTGVFYDTLVVTTSNQTVVQVALEGRATVSSVDAVEPACYLYPNPSSGIVHWCSEALEEWSIINDLGTRVATTSTDDHGRGVFKTVNPGFYMLVSDRTGISVPFIVIK